MDAILTLGELAEFLKVHPATIYRLVREQRIPAFRVGSDWRFHQGEIKKWMNEREAFLSSSLETSISQARRPAQGRVTKLRATGRR